MTKIVVFFLLSLSVSLVLMLGMHEARETIKKDLLSEQAQVIAENVEGRFVDYFNHIAYSAFQMVKIRN